MKTRKTNSQGFGHIVNKLFTIFKEERHNLHHKIRAALILQLLQLSELIVHKTLLKTNKKPYVKNPFKPLEIKFYSPLTDFQGNEILPKKTISLKNKK